jgi:hypothetical protein
MQHLSQSTTEQLSRNTIALCQREPFSLSLGAYSQARRSVFDELDECSFRP